jgi:hypothetical protein
MSKSIEVDHKMDLILDDGEPVHYFALLHHRWAVEETAYDGEQAFPHETAARPKNRLAPAGSQPSEISRSEQPEFSRRSAWIRKGSYQSSLRSIVLRLPKAGVLFGRLNAHVKNSGCARTTSGG